MTAGAMPRRARIRHEARVAASFLRRDFLMAWSYRTAFVADAINMFTQALLFVFVSRLVDSGASPEFGGTRGGYLEFVTVGIAVAGFLAVGLGRLDAAIRTERYYGTLEAVLISPVRLGTLQVGWLAYDVIYVPVRMALFLVIMAVAFGLEIDPGGAGLALVAVVVLLPFVWGIGAIIAAAALVIRRATVVASVVSFGLMFTSGAYFPLDLFPGPVRQVAEASPVAATVATARRALLDSAGLTDVIGSLAWVSVWSAVALALGLRLFARGLDRELRNGAIGLY